MRLAQSAPAPALPKSQIWTNPFVIAVLIVCAGLSAYHNSFGVPFVFDDENSIVTNPTIESWATALHPPAEHGITVAGRPFLNASLALNYAISGRNVWSYHALNLAIHVATALVLFGVLRRSLERPNHLAPPAASTVASDNGIPTFAPAPATLLAAAAAFLWLLHPIQTESVTYTIQRAESLCGLLLLVTLYCFIRGAAAVEAAGLLTSRRWLGASVIACLLGALTKEVMVAAPVVVALYDRTFVGGRWGDLWARRRGYYLALLGTWVVLAVLVGLTGGRGGTFDFSASSWWRYDLTQFVALTTYFHLMAWPSPLVIDYGTFWVDRVVTVIPGLALLAILLGGTAVAWRSWPAIGFVAAGFFVVLAPSSLPPGTIQMIVEHRLYLPLAAVLVIAVLASHGLLGRRAFIPWLAVGIAYGAITHERNRDYASAVTLFEDTVAKRPHNARAMALLADYSRRAGRLDEARRWLERSLQIDSSPAAVWNNLGDVWQDLNEPQKAVSCFEEALRRKPGDWSTLNNLGAALVLAGRHDEGLARIKESLRLEPNSTRTLANLANALAQCGRMPEAAEQFARLTERAPKDVAAHVGYADTLTALNRPLEAIGQLETAVQLAPNNDDLHDRLGILLGRNGRLREAVAEFQEALRLNPANGTARQNLAIARRRLEGR